jgi:hypothetical protein
MLASLIALGPACGGGGSSGGGGPAGPSMPTLPSLVATAPTLPASLPGTTFPAMGLDTTGVAQPVNTVGMTDLQVKDSLKALFAGGGRIVVNTGGAPRTVVLTETLSVPNNVSVILDGGPDGFTLDGNLQNLRLINIGFQSSLTVERVRFVNARSSQNGAAINGELPLEFLSVIDCTFDNCQTLEAGPDRGGGAIRAWNTRHTRISGSTFNKCAASNGGAVNSLGSRLTIINSKFTQNAAFGTGGGADVGPSGQGGIGGAVYVDNVSNHPTETPQLAIAGCIFNANVANDHAGAVFGYTNPAEPSTSILEACTFAGNVVVGGHGHSGGLYSQAGTLTVRNCTFNLNSVSGNGGAIFCLNTTSTIQNSTFHGNTAGNLGGGIFTTTGNVTLLHTTMAQNHAQLFAGGLFSVATTTTVNNSIFSSNTCTDNPPAGIQVNNSFAGGGNRQWPNPGGGAGKPVSASGTTFGDPVLSALAANGVATTFTMSLGGGSSALNPNPALGGALATDQRGSARDGFPDAGAYENP